MAASWQEYFRFLDELGSTLEELTEIAKEKTAAVRRDDLMGVNECMKREQALSLRLRTMDRRRETLLAGLGVRPDVRLSALPMACPAAVRPQARAAADRLRARYDIYRSAAEVARNTLECNLHELEKLSAERMPPEPGRGSLADIRA